MRRQLVQALERSLALSSASMQARCLSAVRLPCVVFLTVVCLQFLNKAAAINKKNIVLRLTSRNLFAVQAAASTSSAHTFAGSVLSQPGRTRVVLANTAGKAPVSSSIGKLLAELQVSCFLS